MQTRAAELAWSLFGLGRGGTDMVEPSQVEGAGVAPPQPRMMGIGGMGVVQGVHAKQVAHMLIVKMERHVEAMVHSGCVTASLAEHQFKAPSYQPPSIPSLPRPPLALL